MNSGRLVSTFHLVADDLSLGKKLNLSRNLIKKNKTVNKLSVGNCDTGNSDNAVVRARSIFFSVCNLAFAFLLFKRTLLKILRFLITSSV